MLKALTIQNLAVVRHLDVEFAGGLTILTGETGAGKSILIEALGLALGDRADSSLIRSDEQRATVTASFTTLGNETLQSLLSDHELEDGEECILRRVVGADGRSRAYCNAAPISIHLLKEIGEHLVDIHGQHAHQSLLRAGVQRGLLDDYGKCAAEVANTRSCFIDLKSLRAELAELSEGIDDVPSRIDLLRFQLDEIRALDLSVDKLRELESEHRRVAHASRLIAGCDDLGASLFESDTAALSTVVRHQSTAAELAQYDTAMQSVAELLNQAAINLEEAERELAHARAAIETDPARLQEIETLLQQVQDLARKHRCSPEELAERESALEAELHDLETREHRLNELGEAIQRAESRYSDAAEKLHNKRARAAKKMAADISARIVELGITHGQFTVDVRKDGAGIGPAGTDDIEFLVTANPDLPPRPLKKVASGGELSRISLAIQAATVKTSGIPVLVFDEVDTGVGGPTAEIVSRYLYELSTNRQILCITHLPQVASAGEHHYSIGKNVSGGVTETRIQALDEDQRVEEIARMLGGQKITSMAREHARELLSS